MSYQVLARKWRPRNFAELVGQEHVLRALTNALDNDRLHHAFLFTGTRGVGKTTIARILARSLNCEKGVSSTPCGECSACTEINEGRFVDLIEVDAASRTKVDETRELLENVQYAPSRGRYKVYLIDEVHMFSNHSFNALLKTLEEPPPHVKFLLATTDPQKLPVTILSRCLQFNLKRLPVEKIGGHLNTLLGHENIAFDDAAIQAIARAADGSMRDALSLLDQAIAYGSGTVRTDDVHAMLGTIEQSHVADLLTALAAGDAAGLMQRTASLAEHAPDFSGVLAELISALHRIALAQLLGENSDADEAINGLAKKLSPQDVQLYYQIALIGRRDLSLAPDARGGFEMVLLRMLAFRPAETGAVTPAAANNTALSQPRSPSQPHSQSHSPVRSPLQEKALPETHAATHTGTTNTPRGISPAAAIAESLGRAPKKPATKTDRSTISTPIAATASTPPASKPPAAATHTTQPDPVTDEPSDAARHWADLVAQLPLQAINLQLAMNCATLDQTDELLSLSLLPSHKQLLNESRRQLIEQAVQQHTGSPVRVTIEVREHTGLTPAALEKQQQDNRQQSAISEIESDSNVQNLIDTFGASISPGSIQPVDH